MAVLADYKCRKCGIFEAWEARCPACGGTRVVRVIMQAPVVQTRGRTAASSDRGRARDTDRTLQTLANDYGMTDMSNRRGSVAASAVKADFVDPRNGSSVPIKLPQADSVVGVARAMKAQAPQGIPSFADQTLQGLKARRTLPTMGVRDPERLQLPSDAKRVLTDARNARAKAARQ